MEPRTYVSFGWNTEDNGEVDDHGNTVAPGGRKILENIRGGLLRRGLKVTEVDLHETYGWSFTAFSEDVPVWCMIQDAQPWLVITDVSLSFWYRLKGQKPEAQQARVCRAIHDALASGDGARSVSWFGRREFGQTKGKGGAETP